MKARGGLRYVAFLGNGCIVAKSLLKSTAAERAWATGPEDWESLGKDLKYKSRTVARKAVDGNGNPVLDDKGEQRKYEEKVVVYWSRSFYERQRHENKSFLDFVEEFRKNPNGFRVTKANCRSLRKFLKKKGVNTETGEELGVQGMEDLRTSGRGTLHDAGRRRRGHWDDPQGVRRGRHAPGLHERRADQAEVVDIGLLMV